MNRLWTAPCTLALLVLQLASACGEPKPPPSPDPDTTAPSTRATPTGGTYGTPVTVSLLCDDGSGSGCATTHYTVDGSEPTRSSPSFRDALSLSTATTLKFFSVDKQGNTESVKSERYVFTTSGDSTPPVVSASPPGGLYKSALTVTLSCEDVGGSGCASLHYTLDGSAPTASSPTYSAPLTVASSTTLKFFARDGAGNASSLHSQAYLIDGVGPTTRANPVSGTYSYTFHATLTCGDTGGSGCGATYYTLDGSPPTEGSPRYVAPLPINASTTLRFFSVDGAGNAEPTQTATYLIDSTPPTTTATPKAGTYGGPVSVTLACDDGSGSGCKATYYTTNGTAPTSASSRYQPGSPLFIDAHTALRFFSVDDAGNAELVQVAEYKLDTQPPVTTATPRSRASNGPLDVKLSCTDAASACTIWYTLDGSTPDTSAPPYDGRTLRITSSTTLKFFAVDALGNREALQSESYVIDTVAPTVSANPPGGYLRAARDVELRCDDGTGSGCSGTIWYTTDGSPPTESSRVYAPPLTLSAPTTLKFFSKDAVGNVSTVVTHQYLFDTQPPTTSANIPGGDLPGPRYVTLTCTDTGGSECDATWYTLDGSTPTTSSSRATGPILISKSATLKFFSLDKAGNVEPVRSETYVLPLAPEETSAQLAAVRAAPEGPIELPIQEAFISYVKPETATDPAGFFLQAERTGPALFVTLDPASLAPGTPSAGQRVSMIATTKSVVEGQTRVTSVKPGSFVLHGYTESIRSQLTVDASAVDLTGQLDTYESRLVSVTGTLTSPFGSSGVGHAQANLSTAGNPNTPGTPTDLKLRMPLQVLEAWQSEYDLNQGCTVTVTNPLWRFRTAAQVSIWNQGELLLQSCPAPRVVNVVPTSRTSLTVYFDRVIDPGGIWPDGSQFTFDNGLVASAAEADERTVKVTTSAQESGRAYTLTVSSNVRDLIGTTLDPTARTGSFTGFRTPAVLRLTEVAPHLSTFNGTTYVQRDVVELYVVTSGNTANMTVTTDDFLVATLPAVEVQAGDLILVHLSPDTSTNGDAPASEKFGKSEHPQATYRANQDTAWDFHGTANGFISYTNAVLRVRDPAGTTQDAAAFAQANPGTPPPNFPSLLQALQAEGLWQPPDCNGVPCTYNSYPTARDVSAWWGGLPLNSTHTSDSLSTVARVRNLDSDTGSDWLVGPSTLGRLNE